MSRYEQIQRQENLLRDARMRDLLEGKEAVWITGSRVINAEMLKSLLAKVITIEKKGWVIVTTDNKGVGQAVIYYAHLLGIPFVVYGLDFYPHVCKLESIDNYVNADPMYAKTHQQLSDHISGQVSQGYFYINKIEGRDTTLLNHGFSKLKKLHKLASWTEL